MHLGYLHQSLILFILMEVLSGYEEREREDIIQLILFCCSTILRFLI